MPSLDPDIFYRTALPIPPEGPQPVLGPVQHSPAWLSVRSRDPTILLLWKHPTVFLSHDLEEGMKTLDPDMS